MKANIGTIDQVIRILLGIGLIAATLLGFIGLWGWLGIILVLTGAFRFCPLYRILGFNTCGMK